MLPEPFFQLSKGLREILYFLSDFLGNFVTETPKTRRKKIPLKSIDQSFNLNKLPRKSETGEDSGMKRFVITFMAWGGGNLDACCWWGFFPYLMEYQWGIRWRFWNCNKCTYPFETYRDVIWCLDCSSKCLYIQNLEFILIKYSSTDDNHSAWFDSSTANSLHINFNWNMNTHQASNHHRHWIMLFISRMPTWKIPSPHTPSKLDFFLHVNFISSFSSFRYANNRIVSDSKGRTQNVVGHPRVSDAFFH